MKDILRPHGRRRPTRPRTWQRSNVFCMALKHTTISCGPPNNGATARGKLVQDMFKHQATQRATGPRTSGTRDTTQAIEKTHDFVTKRKESSDKTDSNTKRRRKTRNHNLRVQTQPKGQQTNVERNKMSPARRCTQAHATEREWQVNNRPEPPRDRKLRNRRVHQI